MPSRGEHLSSFTTAIYMKYMMARALILCWINDLKMVAQIMTCRFIGAAQFLAVSCVPPFME